MSNTAVFYSLTIPKKMWRLRFCSFVMENQYLLLQTTIFFIFVCNSLHMPLVPKYKQYRMLLSHWQHNHTRFLHWVLALPSYFGGYDSQSAITEESEKRLSMTHNFWNFLVDVNTWQHFIILPGPTQKFIFRYVLRSPNEAPSTYNLLDIYFIA